MRTVVIALVCVSGACFAARAQETSLVGKETSLAENASALFTGVANKIKTIDQPKAADAAKPRAEAPKRLEIPKGRVCFNPSETREKIGSHHLAEPFKALRASRFQGEALKVRLCRWKPDDFVYEVSVLRRDGRVIRVFMNASNGQNLGSIGDGERK